MSRPFGQVGFGDDRGAGCFTRLQCQLTLYWLQRETLREQRAAMQAIAVVEDNPCSMHFWADGARSFGSARSV